MNRIKSAFQEGTKYVPLLLSILITGLAYGLYKVCWTTTWPRSSTWARWTAA